MDNFSPRQRRRAKTLQRILATSQALVATGGIDALTLSNVARALDLTTAALYRYFPSKGALLSEVNRGAIQELRGVVARVQAGSSLNALLGLVAVIEATVLSARQRPDIFALINSTIADPRVLVENPADAVHIPELMGLLSDLRPMLDGASQSGALQPGVGEDRVMILVFSMLGVLQLQKLSRFRPTLSTGDLARSSGLSLLIGWGADRGRIQALHTRAQTLARSAVTELL